MCVLYYPVLSHFHLLAIQFNYRSSIVVSCYCGHRVDSICYSMYNSVNESSKRELDSVHLCLLSNI